MNLSRLLLMATIAMTTQSITARAHDESQAKPVAGAETKPLGEISTSQTPTASDLMKGSKIPEHRDFPPNAAISPCENFYEHACSLTVEPFVLPANKSSWNFSFTDLDEKLLTARTNYLQALKNFEPTNERGQSLKAFYSGCMDPKASAQDEKAEVNKAKKTIDGLKTREQFIDYVSSQLIAPHYSFINQFAMADQNDPNKAGAAFMADVSTLPEKTYYDKAENIDALKKVVSEFFKTLKIKDPAKHAENVVKFEMAYAKGDLLPNVYRERFGSKNDVSRPELLTKYPQLQLQKILDRFPKDLQVRVPVPETLVFINEALQSYDLDALKDVYLFHEASGYMDDAYPKFFKTFFDFNHAILGGPAERRPRNERCAEEIKGRFGKEFDEQLIVILFKDFPKSKVQELAEKVRHTLSAQIHDNKWLSRDGRKEAQHKIDAAKLYLVSPETLQEWDFNPLLSYDPKHPVENRMRLHQAKIDKELKELFEPRNRVRWSMGPLVLNAYYSQTDNKFTLLQGILQPPFFEAGRSEIENLGAIGAVVGHELGHSIDDQGSKYDADGKFHQWMSEQDQKEFHKHADRFVDLYSSIGHDGKLTLGENIGDHVGLRAAYQSAFGEPQIASQASVEDKRKFFYSFAHMWCQKMLPKFAEMRLKTDPHSLGYARVNQQVQQMDGFYDAFECKAGDKMYRAPQDRLTVW